MIELIVISLSEFGVFFVFAVIIPKKKKEASPDSVGAGAAAWLCI